MNFIVVEMIDGVNITATIIDRTVQLWFTIKKTKKKLIKENMCFEILYEIE